MHSRRQRRRLSPGRLDYYIGDLRSPISYHYAKIIAVDLPDLYR